LLIGSGVAFARLLSVGLGVFHIWQTVALGEDLGGTQIGLLAGLLLAISPMHIWYSQEIRMYILLAVLATAATHELWRILNGRGHWMFYTLYTILSLYTHNFAAFVLLAHAIWIAVWYGKHGERQVPIRWMGSILLLAVFYAPWVPVLIEQTRFHTMGWIAAPGISDLRDIPLRLILGSAVLALPGFIRWALLLGAVVVLAWPFFIFRTAGKRLPLGFVAACAALPLLAIALISLFYPIFQFKQFLVVLAPLLIWVAWSLLGTPRLIAIPAALLLIFSTGASTIYQQTTFSKDDWRSVSAYLQEQVQPGDVIYGNPAAIRLGVEAYHPVPAPALGYPPDYHILTGGWTGGEIVTAKIAEREMTQSVQGARRLWLVEFHPELWDPGREIERWLENHASLQADTSFGNIRLRLYQLEASQ
jgi:uncharacterized membrane protein